MTVMTVMTVITSSALVQRWDGSRFWLGINSMLSTLVTSEACDTMHGAHKPKGPKPAASHGPPAGLWLESPLCWACILRMNKYTMQRAKPARTDKAPWRVVLAGYARVGYHRIASQQ
jgi:hypothetical protein